MSGRNKGNHQRGRKLERHSQVSADPVPPYAQGGIVESIEVKWNYPIPPPQILQEYGFIKDGPERFLKLAEDQAKHRQRLEDRDSRGENFQRVLGTFSGMLVGLAGVGGGIFLIQQGNDISGFVTLIGTLAVLVAAVQGPRRTGRNHGTENDRQTDLFTK